MSKKATKVLLVNDNEKVGDQSFEINHAERLLQMKNNGGWKLPQNSPYKLEKNGLIKRANSGNTQKSEKQSKD